MDPATPQPILFSGQALERVVQQALEGSPIVPAGARGAFLTVANQHGIKAVIAVKVADRWEVKAVVEHGWHDAPALTAAVSITGTF